MSLATLKMPRLGETMEQGEITSWLVEVGQSFARGEAILEVETDKTVVEYPALGAGKLAEILATEGDMVIVGDPIARIELGDAADWTDAKNETVTSEPAPRSAPTCEPTASQQTTGERLRATPKARMFARRAYLDLGSVTGTGRRGRIEVRDVDAMLDTTTEGGVRIARDIAYVEAGPKNGSPFLLIHGFAGDHTTFALLTNGLKKAGKRVVACDLPGHGGTEIAAKSAADLTANLVDFTRQVMGTKPFHLVAHSLGAVPALALTEVFDIASLTLLAPVGLAKVGNNSFLTTMAAPASMDALKTQLDVLTQTPTVLSDTAISEIFAEQSRNRLVDLAAALGSKQHSIQPALEKLARKIPVRLLLGDSDRIVGTADLVGLAPEIAVHRFANTGHMPHWEKPRAVLNILLAQKG